jgi:hypothetical protein
VFDAAEHTDYLIFPDMLKARPVEEGGQRHIFLEASNEARDYQNEVVLAKALASSADYYLKFGNLDLDHLTQIGAVRGIPDYPRFEIGQPADVKVDGSRVFVKGTIFQGDGRVADSANMFWATLTGLRPPQRWFPSVGGAVRERATELDPETRTTRTVIKSVRWTNIGFSKTPVNLNVPEVSTVPLDMLAKSWGPAGLDLRKALEAGYATDSAHMSGGAALGAQSVDRYVQSYWDFRDRIARDLRHRRVEPTAEAITRHATTAYGVNAADAAEWAGRFLAGLKADLSRRKKQ